MSDLAPTGNATPVAPRVSMQTKISYGIGGFGKDFSLALVNTFLFFYLTDVANVSAAAVGIIFLIARVWDTVNDPIFGYIAAKYNKKIGYKPWIFFGNILNALFMVACFSTHYFEGTFQLVYLFIVYIGWGMAYTMLDAPFWSLIPTITLDKNERESLLPYPRFTATIGNYLAAGLGIYAVNLFGANQDGSVDQGFGYLIYAAIGGILAIISAVVTCKWTEQNYEASGSDTFSLKEAAFVITHNKQFLIFLALAFCYIMATGLMNALNLYIFKYALGYEGYLSTQVFAASVTAVPCLLFFKPIVNFLGRKILFIAAISVPFATALCVSLAVMGFGDPKIMVVLSGFFWGFTNSVYWLIVMIMVADIVDYGDYTFNIRSECIYYSFHTLLSKCSGAVSSSLVSVFLVMISYIPNQEQSASTISSMNYLYLASAALCLVGTAIYIFKYKLNGDTLSEIQRELTRRYVSNITKKAILEGPISEEQKTLATPK